MIKIHGTIATGSFQAGIYPELRYVWCAPATHGGMLPNGDTEVRARLIAAIAAKEFGITITYNPWFQRNRWRYLEYHWGSLPTHFEIEGLTDDQEGTVPLLYVCLD